MFGMMTLLEDFRLRFVLCFDWSICSRAFSGTASWTSFRKPLLLKYMAESAKWVEHTKLRIVGSQSGLWSASTHFLNKTSFLGNLLN